jgi:hypothetical protein
MWVPPFVKNTFFTVYPKGWPKVQKKKMTSAEVIKEDITKPEAEDGLHYHSTESAEVRE